MFTVMDWLLSLRYSHGLILNNGGSLEPSLPGGIAWMQKCSLTPRYWKARPWQLSHVLWGPSVSQARTQLPIEDQEWEVLEPSATRKAS